MQYRVCGTREVLGARPGDEFTADLDEVQEQRLVDGGHIERVVTATTSTWRSATAHDDFPDVPDVRAGEPDQKE